jgi:hypothetical protein
MHPELELDRNAALRWTAWNNGQHARSGNGYGLRIPIADRDRYFDPAQNVATLILPGSDGEVRVLFVRS